MSKSAILLWVAGIVAFVVLGFSAIAQYDKAHPDYQKVEFPKEPDCTPGPVSSSSDAFEIVCPFIPE